MANPNKPREIKVILAKNHERLLDLLQNLSPGKGDMHLILSVEEAVELIISVIANCCTASCSVLCFSQL